jgi:imidazole glycerol-phosphate synthase subunit HisH
VIALIDYGIGNLRSVEKALRAVGAEVILTDRPEVILSAARVVLPGVGAFGDGIRTLQRLGLDYVLTQVRDRGTPLLGICLGMQLLFDSSDEMGNFSGLGFLPGRVTSFPKSSLKVPQTGWNQIVPVGESPLLAGLPPNSYAYFNHGYYCIPEDPSDVLAWTEYGEKYASVVGRGNIYGAQFHPEKSQSVGLLILRNFVERC